MTKKILVVDDEPEFIEMISLRLEANGYEVMTAFSGDECLEKIQAGTPDAVLLDVLMPGVDGIETLRRIRKHNKELPVFIVTAHPNDKRFKQARKLDVSGFVVKTSDLNEEVSNITNILRMSPMYKAKKTKAHPKAKRA
ncbi:MAG: response regulator [Candidatus Omnitrophota bacterium]